MSELRVNFVANERDLAALDERIHYMGFSSRSEYFRACIDVTVNSAALADASGQPLDPATRAWIEQMREHGDRRHDDEVALLEYIGKVGMPVIAMKGLRTAFKVLKNDLTVEMVQRIGRAFSEDEIWKALNAYATYHRAEIENYRLKTTLELYTEVKTE